MADIVIVGMLLLAGAVIAVFLVLAAIDIVLYVKLRSRIPQESSHTGIR
ncbi:hypothetical protein JVX93_05460 [Mycolicibacterium boenickei]|nr:hypothetical protein JVX93_05460 [Mycolicibacterium boenickei]